LQRSRNNVSIYSRQLDSGDKMEMKAEAVVETSLSNLVAIISDVDYYPNWMYRCSESRIIDKISETEFYYYLVTTVPWPVSNRDMVIHVKLNQDETTGVVEVDLQGVPDYMEDIPGFVRVQVFQGKWIMKPLTGGKIKVIQKLLVAPNGEMPMWMVNLAAIEGPYGTMVGMIEKINDGRFDNKQFDFLKNKVVY
jgi:ribosome-associated toxin RatA of RatAB toxin-antitoxin module